MNEESINSRLGPPVYARIEQFMIDRGLDVQDYIDLIGNKKHIVLEWRIQ